MILRAGDGFQKKLFGALWGKTFSGYNKRMGMESITEWILDYRYAILFPLAIVEGPVVMALGGFLLRLGHFNFLPLYLVLMAGDLVADIFWYGIGYFWGHPFIKKFGKYFSVSESLVEKVKNNFRQHESKILFLSKITMGFGFALVTLITAGLSKVPFRKYLLFNFFGQFIWTAILIGLGYFFGNIYLLIDEGVRNLSVFAFVIVLLFAMIGFGKYMRSRASEKNL